MSAEVIAALDSPTIGIDSGVRQSISPEFEAVLRERRHAYNFRWSEARNRFPHLTATDAAAFFVDDLAPLIDALSRLGSVSAEQLESTCDFAVEIGTKATGLRLLGMNASQPWVTELWRTTFPALAQHIVSNPHAVITELSHATAQFSAHGTARPQQWLRLLTALGPQAADLAQLRLLGKVIAWRSGLAHFRNGALKAMDLLPSVLVQQVLDLEPALSGKPLLSGAHGTSLADRIPGESPQEGVEDGVHGVTRHDGVEDGVHGVTRHDGVEDGVHGVTRHDGVEDGVHGVTRHDGVEDGVHGVSPWDELHQSCWPESVVGTESVLAKIGAFRGLGGVFTEPPILATRDGDLIARSGNDSWLITTDLFGSTLHRIDDRGVAAGTDVEEPVLILGDFVILPSGVVELGAAAPVTSAVQQGNVLAITTKNSHAIWLLAVGETMADETQT
jgi:hypothetical protein